MQYRSFGLSASVVCLAVLAAAAGCGSMRGGSGMLPENGIRGSSVRPNAKAGSSPWIQTPLVQTITTVGGATSISSGAWVSDASLGSIERVTVAGATAFSPPGVAQVFGLSPGPDGIVFDQPSGYGDQPNSGPATIYPVPIPSGASFVPSEIGYDGTSEDVFIGGFVANGPNCTDGIDEVPAGGTVGSPFVGTMHSTPCGASLLHLDSTGTAVWFSEGTTTKYLSYVSLTSSKTTDKHLPAVAAGATPGDLAAGPNGDVYFSLCNVTDTRPGGGSYLVRVNASSNLQTVFSTYSACANTRDSIVYDQYDGRIWLANGTNTLTAVRTSDGAVSTYALPAPGTATSGFVAVTVGPDRSLWAFRNGDAFAHAYPDDLIAAVPSYAYAPKGQPVTVQVAEYKYSGSFTAAVVSGSDAGCTVTPIAGGGPQTSFSVASPVNSSCTVAFSDSTGLDTVYVPVVTRIGSGIPPQPR